jgi:hypothetical protein
MEATAFSEKKPRLLDRVCKDVSTTMICTHVFNKPGLAIVRPIPMHAAIIERFPRLGMLWDRSKTAAADNYFGIYDSPTLFPGTEKQFIAWESLLQALDPESLNVFLRKAAGSVTGRTNPDRGWSQLVESMNEVRGYQYAQSLGYTTVRLLDEQGRPLPDIEASETDGRCLIEVKTIQESDEELQMRGQIQSAQPGLPLRLKRLLKKRYSHATNQIAGHPWADHARKICYMVINLDLRTLLADENKELLQAFIQELQTDVEIYSISQYWPSDPKEA